MAKAAGHGGRDSPDYGISNTYNTQAMTLDMNELAVRLGSTIIFDRTGTLIYHEEFQGGLNTWLTGSSGLNCKPTLNGIFFYRNPYSVRFRTSGVGTAASVLNSGLVFPYQTRLGINFSYRHVLPLNRFKCEMILYTGTYRVDAVLTLDFTNDLVLLQDDTWAHISIEPSYVTTGYANVFNPIKCVIDFETYFYRRLMIGEYDINVSDIPIYKVASTQIPALTLRFTLTPLTGVVETIYLDNIIITLDEPA